MSDQLEVMSTTRFKAADDVYKIVDTLNRTLKDDDLMFGLALDEKDSDYMVFTIYRT